jgi:hypothetical protein
MRVNDGVIVGIGRLLAKVDVDGLRLYPSRRFGKIYTDADCPVQGACQAGSEV